MLHVERQDGTLIWTIDRPQAKNALDHATLDALLNAASQAAHDSSVRAAVITGAGDVFVSGGDLRELRGRHSQSDAERLTDAGHALTSAISELPIPVIAALSGAAIGGGAELALACDLRIADASARIAFKQVRMGVTTAWGTVARLVALVGSGTAMRVLTTAQDISAGEAKQLGLIDEVTDEGQCMAKALAWAADVALGSPKAIAETKRLVRATDAVTARAVRPLEREAFVSTWTSADHQEALEAYFERRPARWSPS